MTVALDLALCALILAVALGAVAGRGLFRAVVFFIVYGLLIAVAWVRLGEIDVALAEAAIGAGLTGVLLLAAHGRLNRMGTAQDAEHGAHLLSALAGAALAAALAWAWFVLPLPDRPGPELAEAMPRAGVENPVTAVLLNFRAWDTLLESIVLLAALIGLWMLTRERHWPGRLGLPQHVRAGGVLAGFGRVLPPVGLLIGAWLVWAGADRHGGAFQGGTVLAAVGLVAAMAGLIRPPRIGARLWHAALVVGPAIFVLAGLGGAVLAGEFLTLPPPIAKPAILTIEIALTASIATTLAFLVLGPPEAEGAP
jgi:multisubunit Na+/H+ antiporter MnhB subunit